MKHMGPTGSERVLEFLRDRRFHTLAEIEQECGVEGRSRLSDLRRQGHVLERRQNPGGLGKAKYSHRLVQTALERAVQSDQIVEAESSQTPSSALARAHDAHPDRGSGVEAGGLGVQPSPEPAGDGDTGWRELFPPESAGEVLPPPGSGRGAAAAWRCLVITTKTMRLRSCVGERSSRIDVDEQLELTEALLAAPRRFRDLTTREGRAEIAPRRIAAGGASA